MLRLLAPQKEGLSTWQKLLPIVLLATLSMGGCASTGSSQEGDAAQERVTADPQDPWEGCNRRVFAFNDVLDRYALKPVARGYKAVTPEPVQTGVGNFFSNLGEVRTVLNSLLQGKFQRSGETTARLLFNSIFGLAGIFDVAEKMGLPQQDEDFGQTLGVWGVPAGPYLVIPFLGPSSLRDGTGRVADWVIEDYVNYMDNRDFMNDYQATWGIWAIDLRYGIPFRYGALDSPFEYDQVRYLHTKLREFEISH